MDNFKIPLRSGRWVMPMKVALALGWTLRTHFREGVHGASWQNGLAQTVMRNQSLPDRVVLR